MTTSKIIHVEKKIGEKIKQWQNEKFKKIFEMLLFAVDKLKKK